MGLARFSTLFLALLIASPALWSAFVTKQLDPTTALLRYLIAVPVAAVMLAVVRMVTKDFGKDTGPETTDSTVRAEAIAGEPMARRNTDDRTIDAG